MKPCSLLTADGERCPRCVCTQFVRHLDGVITLVLVNAVNDGQGGLAVLNADLVAFAVLDLNALVKPSDLIVTKKFNAQ